MVENDVAIIGFVGNDMPRWQASHQWDRRIVIAGIAAGQDEAHGAAQAIDRDMPFAGQTSSRAPQSLVATPPF